jgi:hypothetical protein
MTRPAPVAAHFEACSLINTPLQRRFSGVGARDGWPLNRFNGFHVSESTCAPYTLTLAATQ